MTRFPARSRRSVTFLGRRTVRLRPQSLDALSGLRFDGCIRERTCVWRYPGRGGMSGWRGGSLWKAPGYTAAAVVTLALAIGANSAIFGAVQAVLLRPLPIERPGDVVIAWEADPASNHPVIEVSYRQLRAAGAPRRRAVSRGWRRSARPRGPRCSRRRRRRSSCPRPACPRTSSRRSARSRCSDALFRAADDVPNAAPTVIVSHKLWRTHLNADPAIVGKPLRLDRRPARTAGHHHRRDARRLRLSARHRSLDSRRARARQRLGEQQDRRAGSDRRAVRARTAP